MAYRPTYRHTLLKNEDACWTETNDGSRQSYLEGTTGLLIDMRFPVYGFSFLSVQFLQAVEIIRICVNFNQEINVLKIAKMNA